MNETRIVAASGRRPADQPWEELPFFFLRRDSRKLLLNWRATGKRHLRSEQVGQCFCFQCFRKSKPVNNPLLTFDSSPWPLFYEISTKWIPGMMICDEEPRHFETLFEASSFVRQKIVSFQWRRKWSKIDRCYLLERRWNRSLLVKFMTLRITKVSLQ